MRLETFPLVLGAALGLIGLALVFDAWVPDNFIASEERRLRPRRERDRTGEALVGLGALAMAVTFVAGDAWRYSVVTVVAGTFLLLWGVKRSNGYLRGVLSRRHRPKATFVEGTRRVR